MGPNAGMLSLHCVVPSLISRLCSLLPDSDPQEKTKTTTKKPDGNHHTNIVIPNVCKHPTNKEAMNKILEIILYLWTLFLDYKHLILCLLLWIEKNRYFKRLGNLLQILLNQ